MSFRLLLLSLAFLGAAIPAQAEQPEVPQEVIDECQSDDRVGAISECIMKGAVASNVLTWATSDDGYGEPGRLVVAACREDNPLSANSFACFISAAVDAVQTRDLIGVENIKDACLAGISKPTTLREMGRQVQLSLEAPYLEEGLTLDWLLQVIDVRAFRGCDPEDQAALSASGSDPSDPEAGQKRSGILIEGVCPAADEVVARVAEGRDVDDVIEALWATSRADGAIAASEMGYSGDWIEFVTEAPDLAIHQIERLANARIFLEHRDAYEQTESYRSAEADGTLLREEVATEISASLLNYCQGSAQELPQSRRPPQ